MPLRSALGELDAKRVSSSSAAQSTARQLHAAQLQQQRATAALECEAVTKRERADAAEQRKEAHAAFEAERLATRAKHERETSRSNARLRSLEDEALYAREMWKAAERHQRTAEEEAEYLQGQLDLLRAREDAEAQARAEEEREAAEAEAARRRRESEKSRASEVDAREASQLREAAARHSAEAAAAQRALEAEREQHELVADRLRQALEEKEHTIRQVRSPLLASFWLWFLLFCTATRCAVATS